MPRHDPAHCDACTRRAAAIDAIAARTGHPHATVAWIAGAITFVGTWQRTDAANTHVDAAELCRMLVADLSAGTPRDARAELEAMGLPTSREIGRVVYALIDAGLCVADERDDERDFAAIYDAVTIETYAARVLDTRPRDVPVLVKHVIVCVLGVAGAVVLAASPGQPSASTWRTCGVAVLGLAWLAWRWPRPAAMRFGLKWSTLRMRHRDTHGAA